MGRIAFPSGPVGSWTRSAGTTRGPSKCSLASYLTLSCDCPNDKATDPRPSQDELPKGTNVQPVYDLSMTDPCFTPADRDHQRTGLMGWLAVTVDETLRLDGLALRRTLDGRMTVSFPSRRDSAGREHYYVRPLNVAARLRLERAIRRTFDFNQIDVQS